MDNQNQIIDKEQNHFILFITTGQYPNDFNRRLACRSPAGKNPDKEADDACCASKSTPFVKGGDSFKGKIKKPRMYSSALDGIFFYLFQCNDERRVILLV